MKAVACSKTPAFETYSDSAWYFISFNAEYLSVQKYLMSVMTAKQTS